MTLAIAELKIDRIGGRGEGVAAGERGPIYVPYALPGEEVRAYVDGDRARLTEILAPSPDRVAPFCPYFTVCGGCALQHWAPQPYQAWKRETVVTALRQAGVVAEVAPLIDAHGEGRRRATFHARLDANAAGHQSIQVGFMQARAHKIVDLESCPVLAPSMAGALPAARAIADVLGALGKPLDILAIATLEGLDIDVRGAGALEPRIRQRLVALAERLDLARISNHGDIVIERRPPQLQMGPALLHLQPGAFLQATEAGEAALAGLVLEAVGSAKHVADLFAGVGTFALRLSAGAEVLAVEGDRMAVQALARGAGEAIGNKGVAVETRDLFRRPLAGGELEKLDAVVFDPPRTGAEAQAQTLALSKVPTVVAVSCSAGTFARDAKILIAGGYRLDKVTPVDQFRYAPHVEIVGVFRKPVPKAGRRGRLLG